MGIYKTYKEAVLANGGTEGVYNNLVTGWFHLDTSNSESWFECNPADYLETLESFLVSGKRLKCGDDVIGIHGTVIKIFDESVQEWNCRSYNNRKRFILQAAADQVETPEEKEAFDRIPNQATIDAMNSEAEKGSHNSASEAFDAIDTTPQQVESLGKCQEFLDGIEWENGDLASLKSCGAELRVIGPDPYSPNHIFCLETVGNGEALYYHKSLLETPAEREERERLEAAYDLYLTARSSTNDYTITFNQFCDSMVKARFFAIVDKTGYRKERKQ